MTYNLPRFHIRHYDFENFAGPRTGEMAPDFKVIDTNGESVRLSDYRGRWVVLEAASVTCSMYSRNVDAMQDLIKEYPDTDFLLLYVREAHPGEKLRQHASIDEKLRAAKMLAVCFGENRRVLVDSHDGQVHRQWGEFPNWIYLIDPNGKIQYRCDWTYMKGIQHALINRAKETHIEHATMEDLSGRSVRHSMKTMKIGGWLAILDFFRSLPRMIREHRAHDKRFLEQTNKVYRR